MDTDPPKPPDPLNPWAMFKFLTTNDWFLSLLPQRVSTPFLPAEPQLNPKNQNFDQKFDFGERGYFGVTKKISTRKKI